VDQTNETFRTLENVWDGVTSESKAIHDELAAFKEKTRPTLKDLKSKYEKICRIYEDMRSGLNGAESSIFDINNRISYYSSRVAAWDGEKAEAIQGKFDAMKERIDRQEDAITDLKEAVAVLRGQVCHCGQRAPSVREESEELDYDAAEVSPALRNHPLVVIDG